MKSGVEDFYRDIAGDVEAWFDTSEFDARHPSGMQTSVNKKVIGIMKNEAGGKIIQKFVGLRANSILLKCGEIHPSIRGVKVYGKTW